MTAAKLIVFAELDWTPGTLQQCEDRAHRIGQKGIVHIHYLVAKNTLDEHVWSALSKKVAIFQHVKCIVSWHRTTRAKAVACNRIIII